MLSIEPAARQDADALAALYERTWRETYSGILPSVSAMAGDARGPRYWRHAIDQLGRHPLGRDAALHIAREGARPVGYAWSGPGREDRAPWSGEIYMLYVLADAQRRGVGRALMDACTGHLVQRGFFAFGVWCVEANARARRFYERLGGAEEGRSTQRVGGVHVNLVGYIWRDRTLESPQTTPKR